MSDNNNNDGDDSDVEAIADQEVHPTSESSFDDVSIKKSQSQCMCSVMTRLNCFKRDMKIVC